MDPDDFDWGGLVEKTPEWGFRPARKPLTGQWVEYASQESKNNLLVVALQVWVHLTDETARSICELVTRQDVTTDQCVDVMRELVALKMRTDS